MNVKGGHGKGGGTRLAGLNVRCQAFGSAWKCLANALFLPQAMREPAFIAK